MAPPHAYPIPPPVVTGSISPGPSHPFGPGSGIRVLPPRPTAEVTGVFGHSQRKERNKNWKPRKGHKDDTPQHNRPRTKGDHAHRNKDGLKAPDGKPSTAKPSAPTPTKNDANNTILHTGIPRNPRDSADHDVDGGSATGDDSEEGEVADEGSQSKEDEPLLPRPAKKLQATNAIIEPASPKPPKVSVQRNVNADGAINLSLPVANAWLKDKGNKVSIDRRPTRIHEETTKDGPRPEAKHPEGPSSTGPAGVRAESSQELLAQDDNRPSRESWSPKLLAPQDQKEHRPAIDSYRPKYGNGAGPSIDMRGNDRSRSPSTPHTALDEHAEHFKKALEEREREGAREGAREGSVESDLNSLENELLGISPELDEEKDKPELETKKYEEKKRSSHDSAPRMKRRQVKMNSAFGLVLNLPQSQYPPSVCSFFLS